MHQCLKCGRVVSTLPEIDEGCPCGSKVFVFTKHGPAPTISGGAHWPAGAPAAPNPPAPAVSRDAGARPGPSFRNGGSRPISASAAPKPSPAPPSLKRSAPTLLPSISRAQGGEPKNKGHDGGAPPDGPSAEPAPVAPPETESPFSSSPAPSPPPSSSPPAARSQPTGASPLQPVSSVSSVASAPISADSSCGEEEYSEVWLAKGGTIRPMGAPAPVAADSPPDPTPLDVENVRQVASGIYEVDVKGLREGPIVVRDADGVYYVRLPFAQLAGAPSEKKPDLE